MAQRTLRSTLGYSVVTNPRRLRTLAALAIPVLALACSEATDNAAVAGGSASAAGGASNEGGSNGGGDHRITLADEMNYAFDSSLSAEMTRVSANGDITFDWSAVTQDMQGRELDPFADVEMMQLMLWRYDEESFLASINDEELDTGRLVAMAYYDTENARDSCQFFDLEAPGGIELSSETLLEYVNPEIYPPGEHAWLIMLATGSAFGQGTRLLAFLEPSEGETRTTVRLTNDSTTLDYTVDLTQLKPISLPLHAGDVTVGWADVHQLTRNAMGADWVPTRITDVAITHYMGYTVADLEEQFLLLEDLASEYYGARLNTGQQVLLSDLVDGTGRAFPGIDEDGIWLVSLTCGSCRSPAPWFLSILSPSD